MLVKRVKKKIDQLTGFQRIPPNIIVFEILPYQEITNLLHDDESPKFSFGYRWGMYEMECFGYFKLDGLRHIWLIFRSHIICVNISIFKYMKWNKMITLNFRDKTNFYLSKKHQFNQLQTLEIKTCTNIDIFNEYRFPNLKHLTIRESPNRIGNNEKLNWNHKNFSKLKTLTLGFTHDNDLVLFTIRFPELEVLNIDRSVSIEKIHWENFPKLNSFYYRRFSSYILYSSTKIWVNKCKIENCSEFEVFTCILSYTYENLKNGIKNCPFQQLKRLCIEGLALRTFEFPLFQQLTFLCIHNSNITDLFFQKVKFEQLKRLYIDQCHKIEGYNWNSSIFRKLETLALLRCSCIHMENFTELIKNTYLHWTQQSSNSHSFHLLENSDILQV